MDEMTALVFNQTYLSSVLILMLNMIELFSSRLRAEFLKETVHLFPVVLVVLVVSTKTTAPER